MSQLAISFEQRVYTSRKLGAEAGQRAVDRTEVQDPAFRERALKFIVAYVKQQGQATGESATLAAVLAGIRPPDQRAFGPVYQQAIREGLIHVAGYVPRVRGHGSAGGKLYKPGRASA